MITAHYSKYLSNWLARAGNPKNIASKHRRPCLVLNFDSASVYVFKFRYDDAFQQKSVAGRHRYRNGVFDVILSSETGVIDAIETTLTLSRAIHVIKECRRRQKVRSFAFFYHNSSQRLPAWKGVFDSESNGDSKETKATPGF